MTIAKKVSATTFKTVSGKPITIGFGSGTKWQWLKKGRPAEEKDSLAEELVEQIKLALDLGVNHIDTAEIYTTHPEVAAAVKRSGKAREDLFITTKYNPGPGEQKAQSKGPIESIDKALADLNTDYVDLFLIHTPGFKPENSYGHDIKSAWKEFIEIKKSGKARYVGVSNFAVEDLKETFSVSASPEEYPKVNQIEFHPYLQNQTEGIVDFSRENDIQLEAYGPLTPLFRVKKDGVEITDHPLHAFLPELASKYGKTEAQILLKYTILKGFLPITTSSKEERIKQSLDLDFDLDESDFTKIDTVGSSFHFRGFFLSYDKK